MMTQLQLSAFTKNTLLKLIVVITLLVTISCSKDEEGVDVPEVHFNASDSVINEQSSITFTDLSSNMPSLREWTFEGGTPGSSSEVSPSVQYNTPGIYNVKLKVSNQAGEDEIIKEGFITVIPANGMVAYYPFDNNINDVSGSSLQAEDYNISFTKDKNQKANSAVYFTDSTHISILQNEKLNFGADDFSLSLWFNTENSSTQMVYQKGGTNGPADPQYWLRLNDNAGVITFLTGDGTPPSVTTSYLDEAIAINEWYHVVTVRNGDKISIYLNNELISSTSSTAKNTDNLQNLLFGTQVQNNAFVNSFVGAMDEIRIYKEALTESEIEVLFKMNY